MDQDAPVTDTNEADRLWRWQSRLLPFMVIAISALALFFFVSTFFQIGNLNQTIRFDPASSLKAELAMLDAAAKDLPADQRVELAKWKTVVLLEEDTVRRRYQQVNATLQMRAWTRHMGFVTGMMMAFVGAIFIMSKLSEQSTSLSGEAPGMKASLATSSPGIILSVLGTLLMSLTLNANFSFTTTDVPVYLPPGAQARPTDLPPPSELETGDTDALENKLFDSPAEGETDEKPSEPPSG